MFGRTLACLFCAEVAPSITPAFEHGHRRRRRGRSMNTLMAVVQRPRLTRGR